MQGKGLIKFFLFLMLALAVYQVVLVFNSRGVEKAAAEYAETKAQDAPEEERKDLEKQYKADFLDSMSTETVFELPLIKKFTYPEVLSKQLKLGLDLKGGMSVILQVDLREFIRSLAKGSKDPTFTQALDLAYSNQKDSQEDFVSLFMEAFQTKATELGTDSDPLKLAKIFARNESLSESINNQSSNADIALVLREKADETVKTTFEMLKQRLDKDGTVQPTVTLDQDRGLISVELPGIDNPEAARASMISSASLEFYDVYKLDDRLFRSIQQADDRLKSLEAEKNGNVSQDSIVEVRDSILNDDGSYRDTTYQDTIKQALLPGPIMGKIQFGNGQGAIIGYTEKQNRKALLNYLTNEEVKGFFAEDIMFSFGSKPIRGDDGNFTRVYALYAIKKGIDNVPLVEGDNVTKASTDITPDGQVEVVLQMDSKGASRWADATTRAASNNNAPIAILLDNEVITAPSVNSPITGGRSSITGDFTSDEANQLATNLEIGKLPATPRIIQENIVGPTLGAENISRSINALIIGFSLVLLFMILYYSGAGIISIIALLANIIFIVTALASGGTVLTLPGIAGIVLTIGMAVDANVIIFERIREELREGKNFKNAVLDGFNNSYSAIIDANVTTILTAIVLYVFGLGPIKGFAWVLIVGVLCSVFTAVLLARLIMDKRIENNKAIKFSSSFSKNLFTNLNIDWLKKRKIAYFVSGTLIVLGVISMFTRGFDLGVDFKGGYNYKVQFVTDTDLDKDAVSNALTSFLEKAPVVKQFDTENSFDITTDYLINENEPETAEKVLEQVHKGIQALVGSDLTIEEFKSETAGKTHVISSSKVGPTIADDIKRSSFYATIFALLLIFLYLLIRFNRWQFSAGAIAALFHDVLIVLSIFSIAWGFLPFTMEVDQAFIAAILTVVGYSINDTVVVFDRIREYLNAYSARSKEEVINMAVNSTVSRTIITSLTTLFVVLILLVFGGSSIKGFAFALFIGVLVGTYSSIFIATPVVNDLTGDLKAKDVNKEGSEQKVLKSQTKKA